MKYLGNGYHSQQHQVGNPMTKSMTKVDNTMTKEGVRSREQVEDAFLKVGCWVMAGLIVVILGLWAWIR